MEETTFPTQKDWGCNFAEKQSLPCIQRTFIEHLVCVHYLVCAFSLCSICSMCWVLVIEKKFLNM